MSHRSPSVWLTFTALILPVPYKAKSYWISSRFSVPWRSMSTQVWSKCSKSPKPPQFSDSAGAQGFQGSCFCLSDQWISSLKCKSDPSSRAAGTAPIIYSGTHWIVLKRLRQAEKLVASKLEQLSLSSKCPIPGLPTVIALLYPCPYQAEPFLFQLLHSLCYTEEYASKFNQ